MFTRPRSVLNAVLCALAVAVIIAMTSMPAFAQASDDQKLDAVLQSRTSQLRGRSRVIVEYTNLEDVQGDHVTKRSLPPPSAGSQGARGGSGQHRPRRACRRSACRARDGGSSRLLDDVPHRRSHRCGAGPPGLRSDRARRRHRRHRFRHHTVARGHREPTASSTSRTLPARRAIRWPRSQPTSTATVRT